MSDDKYRRMSQSNVTKEIQKEQLIMLTRSENPKILKAGLKEIISYISMGRDFTFLFSHVMTMFSTEDPEMLKLLWLYLINQPQKHAEIPGFVFEILKKELSSMDPLSRATAIKTIGQLNSVSALEMFVESLEKLILHDDDPFVRKCAVLCIAKFYAMDPDLVEKSNLISIAQKSLDDSNSIVICNGIIVLMEISQMGKKNYFPKVTQGIIQKLCALLMETTEWGKVAVLDYISKQEIEDVKLAERILEDIQKCLQNTNTAVVMTAIKVYINLSLKFEKLQPVYLPKLTKCLIALLYSGPETLYFLLRNISLIVQHFPQLLENNVTSFTASCSDSNFVRIEKIDIMTILASESNIEAVLSEFSTYARESDKEIVKKAISSIGRCALKVPKKAASCVSILMKFVEKDPNMVIESAIIVMKDICRLFPTEFMSPVEMLLEHIDLIQEEDAKASLMWFFGEYPSCFDDVGSYLAENYLINYFDEPLQVQLQILTSCAKMYSCDPRKHGNLLLPLLNRIIAESQHPDLRGRCYFYKRLIENVDVSVVKKTICGPYPKIDYHTEYLEASMRIELLKNMCTLASVYHKLPHTFIENFLGSDDSQTPGIGSLSLETNEYLKESTNRQYRSSSPFEDENSDLLISGSDVHQDPYISTSSDVAAFARPDQLNYQNISLSDSAFECSTNSAQHRDQDPNSLFFGSMFGSTQIDQTPNTSISFKTDLFGSEPVQRSSAETINQSYTCSNPDLSGGFNYPPFGTEFGHQFGSSLEIQQQPFMGSSDMSFSSQYSLYKEPSAANSPLGTMDTNQFMSSGSQFGSSGVDSLGVFSGNTQSRRSFSQEDSLFAFQQVQASPISVEGSFLSQAGISFGLNVKIALKTSGIFQNVELVLKPNPMCLLISSSGFSSYNQNSFQCGDIQGPWEKEIVVPLVVDPNMMGWINTGANTPLNVLSVVCSCRNVESVNFTVTIPFNMLFTTPEYEINWNQFNAFQGILIHPHNLLSSYDNAIRILCTSGFQRLMSPAREILRFGAKLINGVEFGLEINFGFSNVCTLYCNNPVLCSFLTQSLCAL